MDNSGPLTVTQGASSRGPTLECNAREPNAHVNTHPERQRGADPSLPQGGLPGTVPPGSTAAGLLPNADPPLASVSLDNGDVQNSVPLLVSHGRGLVKCFGVGVWHGTGARRCLLGLTKGRLLEAQALCLGRVGSKATLA